MKSAPPGRSTLQLEVTNISTHGFWLLIGDREMFLPLDNFLWFRDAAVAQLVDVELSSPHHLYWPDFEIDLAVESLNIPSAFL
jgi:hypothetical protein